MQLGSKYQGRLASFAKNYPKSFYTGSVVAYVLTYLALCQLEESGKKLQHYNPALKQFNDSTLDRVFTRLMIIRKIKAEIEVKTGMKTTWHIREENTFNADALGSNNNARVSFTEAWLTTPSLTHSQFERYLKAILLHELGHVAHRHTSKQLFTTAFQLALSNLLLYYAEKTNSSYTTALTATAVFFDFLIPKVISRMQEYQADAFATRFTAAQDLKEALEFLDPTNDSTDLAKPLRGLFVNPPTNSKKNTTPLNL